MKTHLLTALIALIAGYTIAQGHQKQQQQFQTLTTPPVQTISQTDALIAQMEQEADEQAAAIEAQYKIVQQMELPRGDAEATK